MIRQAGLLSALLLAGSGLAGCDAFTDYQMRSGCAAEAAKTIQAPDGETWRASGGLVGRRAEVTLTYGRRTVRADCGTRPGIQNRLDIDIADVRIAGRPVRPGWVYDLRRRRWIEAINSVAP